MSWDRLCWLAGVLGAIVISLAAPALRAAEHRGPNIVIFLVDDMGWRDCEPYGSTYYETPNMSRLAKLSMRFTEAYAAPLCSPTRASILSGQYPARHRVTSASGHQPPAPVGASPYPEKASPASRFIYAQSRHFLDPQIPTLAELLRAAGYRTGHFGKWHLGISPEHRPLARGFETAWFCVPDPGPPSYFSPYQVSNDPLAPARGRSKAGTITDGPEGEYITDRLTGEALKFIEAHRGEPFFLNLWQYGVHGPWGHKPEYTAEFAKKTDPQGLQKNPIMASMLKSVDQSLGRILDKLDDLNLTEKTLFIFFSDNGGNVHSNREDDAKRAKLAPDDPKQDLINDWRKWAGGEGPTNNAPLREGKGRIYEGGQRVPLMVRWPGRVPEGAVSDAVAGAIDLFPTILDAAGVEMPAHHQVDGLSLLPVLEQKGTLDRDAYFTWFPHLIPAVSVRSGDWKLIRRWEPHQDYPDLRELYNLREDIGETVNLAAARPEKVAELDEKIDRFIAATGALAPRPNPAYREKEGQIARAPEAGLVPKFCSILIGGGALRVEHTGRDPFLGTAQLSGLSGPIQVEMRIRGPAGKAAIRWMEKDQEEFPRDGQSVTYELLAADEWQDVSIVLPVQGKPRIVRIYVPAADGKAVEIQSIRAQGANGAKKAWNFKP